MAVPSQAVTNADPDVWKKLAARLNPSSDRPRIRVDLIETAHHQTRSGEPYVVLCNRVAGTYLKLSAREYDLVELMDGSRSVGELVVQYFLRHKVLAFQRVAGLVSQLREHRFLDAAPPNAYELLGARLQNRSHLDRFLSSVGRWLLGREIVVEGIDAAVTDSYRRWGHLFFTRAFIVFSSAFAAIGLVAFAYLLFQHSQSLFSLGGSLGLGLVAFLVFTLVSTGIHELGHALALKHAGREVRRAGFLMYYGLPTFYVDTTDVWMADRRSRLAVSWAGPHTALLMGALASLGALALSGTLVGDALLAWAFVSYLDVIFNLNPLLELDGYYMLVDLIERPKLRRDALAFVQGPFWSRLLGRQPLTREQGLLAAYGIACAVWTGLSVWLGLFLWERRIGPLVADLWSAEGPLGQLGQALVASVAALIAYALIRLFLRAVWPLITSNSALLARRGQAVRFRETLALLRGLPFLSGAAEASLVEIASLFRPTRVPPGTNVVTQGEIGDSFYLVKRGTLDVIKDGGTVASLGAGSYFGEIALLRRVPRSATVVSQSECDLLMMSGQDFRTRIAHEIETFQRLQSNVELRAELAGLPLLDGLGPTEMDLLLTKLELREHPPGESIVRQGDLGDAFYVVRAGEVSLELNGEKVGTFGPGYYFGEIALLMDVPRTATVRASGGQTTETWSVNRSDFADVLARYLGLAPTLMDAGEARLRTLTS